MRSDLQAEKRAKSKAKLAALMPRLCAIMRRAPAAAPATAPAPEVASMRARVVELEAEGVRLRAENQRLIRNLTHKDTLFQQLKDKYERHTAKMQRVHSKLDDAVTALDAQNRLAKSQARTQTKKHRGEKHAIKSQCHRIVADTHAHAARHAPLDDE